MTTQKCVPYMKLFIEAIGLLCQPVCRMTLKKDQKDHTRDFGLCITYFQATASVKANSDSIRYRTLLRLSGTAVFTLCAWQCMIPQTALHRLRTVAYFCCNCPQQSMRSHTVLHSPRVYYMDPDICGQLHTLCRYTCPQYCKPSHSAVRYHADACIADTHGTVHCLHGP